MATQLGRRPRWLPGPGGPDGPDQTRGRSHGASADAPGDGSGAARAPRLTHEPALDGLRGLAVLAVVVFHLGRLQGGFLGVDLFFALSGFLITSLLLAEHRSRGRIDLRAFWARRMRRLLPAVLVLLVGVGVLLATMTASVDRPRFRGEALATLGYVANWHRMAADVSYWDIFSQPSPLDHTWSLAIEEQFYLVWPLLVVVVLAAGRRRRTAGADGGAAVDTAGGSGARRLGIVAAVAGAASLVALAVLWSPVDTNRAYFGTDTRLGPTLLGAALATVTAGRARRAGPPSRIRDGGAGAALAAMVAAFVVLDGQTGFYYRGGLALFTVAALVVITGVTGGPPGLVARGLSWRPLAALGAISYGVYLWHWPVIVYLTPDRLGVRRIVAQVLCVLVTLGLAIVSYRLVERPVRRGVLRGARSGVVACGAVALVLATVVVTTRGPSDDGGEDLAAAGGGGVEVQAGDRRLRFLPTTVAPGATRLLLVGDSGPIFLAPELEAAAARSEGRWAIGMSSMLDCSPALLSEQVRYAGGQTVAREPCHDSRRAGWLSYAERMQADVVVMYLANAGGLAEQYLDGDWVTDCDPVFDDALAEQLGLDVDALARTGATVVLASSPDVAVFTHESHEQTACRNETYERVAHDHPGTLQIDLHGFFADESAAHPDVPMLRDFVHMSDAAARAVSAWMLPAVDEALRTGAGG